MLHSGWALVAYGSRRTEPMAMQELGLVAAVAAGEGIAPPTEPVLWAKAAL